VCCVCLAFAQPTVKLVAGHKCATKTLKGGGRGD
jgi:hypothetical protein